MQVTIATTLMLFPNNNVLGDVRINTFKKKKISVSSANFSNKKKKKKNYQRW